MMLRKLLQPVYTAWVLLSFVTFFMLMYPVLFVIGLWDDARARKVIFYFLHYMSILWLYLIAMPVKKLGFKPDDKKYIFAGNHISYMDTVVIYAAISKYFRTLGKKEMSSIPLFGFIYKQMAILVDRSSPHSRARSVRLMNRVLRNESNVGIFPEGTFNETDKPLKEFYDGAFKLAINTQTPIVPFIMLDTVHRWHYSAWWRLWPGRNRVVFLEPVAVEGLTLNDLPALKNEVYKRMETTLIAYNGNS
ncbi:MAG: lysophospholipid acyltransferase family protein [Flavipsychrobacter sp.]